LIACGAALLLAGCGGARQSVKTSGAAEFKEAGCGSCHTLAAARTHGVIGPNLDELRPDYATVLRQVLRGGGGMPSFRGKLSARSVRALAAYVSKASAHSGAQVITFVPDHRTPNQCHGDFLCLRQAYGNIAFYKGPKIALALLDRAQRANTQLAGFCHQITHEIGHAALARYHGNAAEALGQGAMTCWSGYYHGVVERAFSGVPRDRVSATASKMCTSLASATVFIRYQCVHGLGHGLMIYSGGDLFYSLRVCDSLTTRWDQSSCTGGVFMQSFLPPIPGMQMATMQMTARQTNDLIYPCKAVAERDKLYCYLQITDRILPHVGYNWRLAARWCHKSEPTWVATCFQSLGRDVSGFTGENARRISVLCAFAASSSDECLYGAVRDMTANDANGKRASTLCLMRIALGRGRCFEAIGSILGGLARERDGRRVLCDKSAPRAYRNACYRGAAAL
jgi:cytochrome c553